MENQPEIQFPTTTFGERNKMNKRILVTYASQAGSTAEIAKAIGKKIADHGFLTDVKPMMDVSQISEYEAVVAGSAIHGGKWLPEGIKFIKSNRSALQKVPFAAFMVCITLGMKNAEQYQEGVRAWMEPVRAIVRPNREGYFAGSLDFKQMPFSVNALAMRAAVKMGALPKGDHGD
jgi:menaquinone-dependent protoporphyrinogen oxidase